MKWTVCFTGHKHQRTCGILQPELNPRSTSGQRVTFRTEKSYWNMWGAGFHKNTNGEKKTKLGAYVYVWSPVTGESHIRVWVKTKLKANFDKSSVLFNKFITTWKASDITGLFWDPLLKRNRTDSPIQNQVKEVRPDSHNCIFLKWNLEFYFTLGAMLAFVNSSGKKASLSLSDPPRPRRL